MTNPIQTAQDAAHAAIKALADAGHRAASEHVHALDLLRAEVESLRVQNGRLRARIEALERSAPWTPKAGDRVRIARRPFEAGLHQSDWRDQWGKVGDVGTVICMTMYGNADVQGIGDSGTDRSYYIDPSCLEPVLP